MTSFGTGRLLCAALWLLLVMLGSPRGAGLSHSAESSPIRDQFGGVGKAVAKGTGFFRVQKVRNRWVFVTPEGHPFWMLGVFAVSPTGSIDDLKDSHANRILKKYGKKTIWAQQTTTRLKSWGFNTVAEYPDAWVLPTPPASNPVKVPFVSIIRPSWYGLTNKWDFAPGPFKELINGTDPSVYTYWRGHLPDVFDPNFEAYVDGWMRKFHREIIGSPWLIGFAMDDADNLFGFGPSAEIPAGRLHPHIGWLALVSASEQQANSTLNVVYTDRKVYTKLALRDFLRNRYSSIEALNAAWGSRYTTWSSDGGWPAGRGFVDESGRNAWTGKSHAAEHVAPAIRRDLDDFLYLYAQRYFSVVAGKIRQHAPQHLVFGPATLNGWNGLTHPSILRAAGEHVDVLQASVRSPRQLELTARYAGDRPIVSWTGMVANGDSALWRYPYKTDVTPGLPTQEERAQVYARTVLGDFNAVTRSGTNPVAGTKFWSWGDHWGEKRNWGLVSFLDNAYDGKEAVRRVGVDPSGYPTGGEERDYGDFISGVRDAHQAILKALVNEIGGPTGTETPK